MYRIAGDQFLIGTLHLFPGKCCTITQMLGKIKCILSNICLRSRNVLANLRKYTKMKIINKMDNKSSSGYDMFYNKIIISI